ALLVEEGSQRQERVDSGEPARGRARGRLRIELHVEMEEIEPVEQEAADEVDHDEEVKAEDGAARANFERRDRHRKRPGDESRRGGDEEGHDDAANRNAAADLRD